MTQTTTLSEVIYNPANQCFEALVSVRESGSSRRYACAIEAPITMSFEDAARGLHTKALRLHAADTCLYSQMRHHVAAVRKARVRLDPRTLLAHLGLVPRRSNAA
jgi:ATP-dependent protease HslVU (ClpYQ) peptidase subunit